MHSVQWMVAQEREEVKRKQLERVCAACGCWVWDVVVRCGR